MTNFLSFLSLEFRRYTCKKNLLYITVILLVALYATLLAVSDYEHTISSSKSFKKAEIKNFSIMKHYRDYSNFGLRVMSTPSASSIFFSSPDILTSLFGSLNSIAELDIHINSRGEELFSGNSDYRIRFSSIVFYIGGLLVLLLGWKSVRNKEYLKQQLSMVSSPRKLYFCILATRFILLYFTFLFIFAILIGAVCLSKVALTEPDLISFVLFSINTLILFLIVFISGVLIGTIGHLPPLPKKILISVLILVLILPGIIKTIYPISSPKLLSSFELNSIKHNFLDKFEELAIKNHGKRRDNSPEGRRIVVEDYWKNYFPLLEKYEISEYNNITERYKKHCQLSLLFPTSFFSMSCDEMSSKGYLNYIDFHKYLIDMQRNFIRFWIDRVYYHDPDVMVNFIKDDENLFRTVSMTPAYFWIGIGVNLFYALMLITMSIILFNRWLFHMGPEEIKKLVSKKETRITLSGRPTIYGWHVHSDAMRNYLYSLLTGRPPKSAPPSKPVIVKHHREVHGRLDFFYLCRQEHIPGDVKTADYLKSICSLLNIPKDRMKEAIRRHGLSGHLSKPVAALEGVDYFGVQMALLDLVEKQIYLIDDFITGLQIDQAKALALKINELIEKKGRLVLQLTQEISYTPVEKAPYDNTFSTAWFYGIGAMNSCDSAEKLIEENNAGKN